MSIVLARTPIAVSIFLGTAERILVRFEATIVGAPVAKTQRFGDSLEVRIALGWQGKASFALTYQDAPAECGFFRTHRSALQHITTGEGSTFITTSVRRTGRIDDVSIDAGGALCDRTEPNFDEAFEYAILLSDQGNVVVPPRSVCHLAGEAQSTFDRVRAVTVYRVNDSPATSVYFLPKGHSNVVGMTCSARHDVASEPDASVEDPGSACSNAYSKATAKSGISPAPFATVAANPTPPNPCKPHPSEPGPSKPRNLKDPGESELPHGHLSTGKRACTVWHGASDPADPQPSDPTPTDPNPVVPSPTDPTPAPKSAMPADNPRILGTACTIRHGTSNPYDHPENNEHDDENNHDHEDEGDEERSSDGFPSHDPEAGSIACSECHGRGDNGDEPDDHGEEPRDSHVERWRNDDDDDDQIESRGARRTCIPWAEARSSRMTSAPNFRSPFARDPGHEPSSSSTSVGQSQRRAPTMPTCTSPIAYANQKRGTHANSCCRG